MNPLAHIPERLIDLVDGLRLAGFNIGVEHYVAVEDLILALQAHRALPDDPAAWRPLLAPVLCSTPKEQRTFALHFDAWLARHAPGLEEETEDPGTTTIHEARWRAFIRRLKPWQGFALAATVLIGAVALLLIIGPEQPIHTLSGQVVSQDSLGNNLPIPDARVSFNNDADTTDGEGQFAFTYPALDTTASLSVSYSEFVTANHRIDLRKDTTLLVVLYRPDPLAPVEDQAKRLAPRLDAMKTRGEIEPGQLDRLAAAYDTLLARLDSLSTATRPDTAAIAALQADFSAFKNQVDRLEITTPRVRLQNAVQRINDFAAQHTREATSPGVLNRFYRRHYPSIQAGVLGLPFLIVLLWWVWTRYRRPMVLERRSTRAAPHLQPVVVRGDTEPLFKGPTFRRTLREMRRHREVVSTTLDAPSTVEATVRAGGLFTPLYGARQLSPEYLVLVDRAGVRDQQARLVDHLVERLVEGDLFVDTYYFDGDPRVCYQKDPKTPSQTLQELAARHYAHRLLVISDGAGLINPVTGRPQNWLDLFAPWAERALLSPVLPVHWGYREVALAGIGFMVLPASEAGLTAFVESIHTGTTSAYPPGTWTPPFPRMLHENPRRWLHRIAPAPATVDTICVRLRQYLGRRGYLWLCACAVYPELHWDLTLYLGHQLKAAIGAPVLTEERLLALTRLPWFRYGRMPDWLRSRLIDDLSDADEQTVRAALQRLLETPLDNPEGGIALDIAYEMNGQVPGPRKPEPEDSSLRDFVFLQTMLGRKLNKLAVRVPAILRRLLFREGHPLLGVRPVAVLVAAALVAVLGFQAVKPPEPLPKTNSPFPSFQVVLEPSNNLLERDFEPPFARSDSALFYHFTAFYQSYENKLDSLISLYSPGLQAAQAGLASIPAPGDTGMAEGYRLYRAWLADTLARASGFDASAYSFLFADSAASTGADQRTTNVLSLRKQEQDNLASLTETLAAPQAVTITTIGRYQIIEFDTTIRFEVSPKGLSDPGVESFLHDATALINAFLTVEAVEIRGYEEAPPQPTEPAESIPQSQTLAEQVARYLRNMGLAKPITTKSIPAHENEANTPSVDIRLIYTPDEREAPLYLTLAGTAPPPGPLVIAAITPTPATPQVNETVRFSAEVSGDEPITYRWDFGDGATATALTPAHAYAQDGTYTIRLTTTTPQDTTSLALTLSVCRAQIPQVIRRAQTTLNDLGYDVGAADGLAGPRFTAQIRRFQLDNNLPTACTMDSATLNKLDELGAGNVQVEGGSIVYDNFNASPDLLSAFARNMASRLRTTGIDLRVESWSEFKEDGDPALTSFLGGNTIVYGAEVRNQAEMIQRLFRNLNPPVAFTLRAEPLIIPGTTEWSIGARDLLLFILEAPAGANRPPAVPGIPTLSLPSSGVITLVWSDNSDNETGFEIERSLRQDDGYQRIASVPANITTYRDASVASNTLYYYRIRAFNANSASGYPPLVRRLSLPAPPSNLVIANTSPTAITLEWEDANPHSVAFVIERRSGTEPFRELTRLAPSVDRGGNPTLTNTRYTDTRVSPDTTYTYRVLSFNSSGDSGYSNEARVSGTVENTTGSLYGRVHDASTGQPLAGATITLTGRTRLQVLEKAVTDNNGYFTISNLAPGSYNLTLEYFSYQAEQDTVAITAGETTTQRFMLTHLSESGTPTEVRLLNTALPTDLPGFARISMEGTQSGSGDSLYTQTVGVYQRQNLETTIQLRIADLTRLSPDARLGFAYWLNTTFNREAEQHLERTTTFRINGQAYPGYEKYDRLEDSCHFQLWVAERFLIDIRGVAVSLQHCEEARGAIDYRALEAMR